MLYQLSYGTNIALLSECKGTPFFLTDQTFRHFFRTNDEKSAEILCLTGIVVVTYAANSSSYISCSKGKSFFIR